MFDIFMGIKKNKLTEEEKRVIIDKGTEPPFTGEYLNHKKQGVYTCWQCNSPLYSSRDKFKSGCGWPSFDDEIPESERKSLDADGNYLRPLRGQAFNLTLFAVFSH